MARSFTRKRRNGAAALGKGEYKKQKQMQTRSQSLQRAAVSQMRAQKEQADFWSKRPGAFKLESFNLLDAEAVNETLMRRWSEEFKVEDPKPKKGSHEYWKNARDTLVLRYKGTLPCAMPEMLVQLTLDLARYEADEIDTAHINGHWYLRAWWD